MFLPENIDLANSEKYNLSIRLAPDGFSFCIYNYTDTPVFFFQETSLGNKLSYVESIKKIVFDLGFFSNSFNKSSVIVVSPYYTLIPEKFFDSKSIKDIFDFNFHNQAGVVLSEKSLDGEFHILFNMNEELHSFLSRHLFNPTIHHHSTSLIQSFINLKEDSNHFEDSLNQNESENDHISENSDQINRFDKIDDYKKDISGNANNKDCFLDFHNDYFTVVCLSGNQLLTANTFTETNFSNISYYIMGIWDKLGFDQNTDNLFISGKSDSKVYVENELSNLIRNIEHIRLEPRITLTDEQKVIVPTDLIATLCV